MDLTVLDQRPVVVAVAGPNGAGKSTFHGAHLVHAGLRFVNADTLAHELDMDPYAAARLADSLRRALLERRESFVFETVFSDPVGEKIGFLEEAVGIGYTVVLCYIGLANVELSEERVAMRVSQGGHENLGAAVRRLPHVLVFDNSDLTRPFQQVAVFDHGTLAATDVDLPRWLADVLD